MAWNETLLNQKSQLKGGLENTGTEILWVWVLVNAILPGNKEFNTLSFESHER